MRVFHESISLSGPEIPYFFLSLIGHREGYEYNQPVSNYVEDILSNT